MKLNLPKERKFVGNAALWKRLVAFVVDMFIIDFFIGFPFRNLIVKLVPNLSFGMQMDYLQNNPKVLIGLSTIMLAYGFLALLYFAILERKTGQTIGKMIMNIVVVENKGYGFLSFMIRSMYLIFIFPFVLLWIIDPLFVVFNKDGRRLSEILSKTRVVEVFSL